MKRGIQGSPHTLLFMTFEAEICCYPEDIKELTEPSLPPPFCSSSPFASPFLPFLFPFLLFPYLLNFLILPSPSPTPSLPSGDSETNRWKKKAKSMVMCN